MFGGRCLLTHLLILAVSWSVCRARSSGAPSSTCTDMMPAHAPSGQQGTPPFTITPSQSTYNGNDIIDVTITGTRTFKGFFLQARVDGLHVGNFNTPPRTRNVACNTGNAVTHSTRLQDISMITLQWTAPANAEGSVTFVATVVENFSTFWVRLESPAVTVSVPPQPILEPTPCQLPTNEMTLVQLSEQSIQVAWEAPESCPGACTIKFTVEAVVGISGNKYVSIGFSKDAYMGDDSVVDCIQTGIGSGATFGVQASYNTLQGKANVPLANPTEGLMFDSGSINGGRLKCVFKRAVNSQDPKVFDLASRRYRLLVATGSVTSGNVKMVHGLGATTRPVMSYVERDFLAPGIFKTLM